MKRKLLHILTALAILLSLFTALLWILSNFRQSLHFDKQTTQTAYATWTEKNTLAFTIKYVPPPAHWYNDYTIIPDPATSDQSRIAMYLIGRAPHNFHFSANRDLIGSTYVDQWYCYVPLWFVFTLSLLPLAPLLYVQRTLHRKRRDLQQNLCPTCRYDLRASPTRCPECGTTIPPNPTPASLRPPPNNAGSSPL